MKNSTRLKKATYSVLFTGIYEIILFISSLIIPRLILTTYGSEYNGIVSSITQFLGIVSILRLGIAGATRIELYKSLGKNDVEKTSQIIKATEIYMRKISLIIFVYALILAIVYPIFVNNSYSFLEVSSLVFIIGLGTFAEYLFGFTYYTLLQSDQKLYIYYIIQTIATFLNITVSCILIKSGHSIQIVKLFSSLIFVLSPLVLYYYVSHKYEIDKNVKPDNTAIKNRGDVAAHSIANIIHENTDIIVLTIFSNIKVVSVYTVYNLVAKGLKQILNIFTTGLESAFGNMWVKKEYEVLNYNFNIYEYFIHFFSSIVFTCSLVLIIPFVKIYTFGVNDIEYVLPIYALIVMMGVYWYSIRMPYQTIIQATGKYKETKKIAWTEALINVTVSIISVFALEIIGVAIGTLCANAYRTLSYSNYMSKNLIIREKMVFIHKVLWSNFNIFVSCLIVYFINYQFNIIINNWTVWIIVGILSFFISTLVTIITSIVFYNSEFKKCCSVFKRLIRKEKKI